MFSVTLVIFNYQLLLNKVEITFNIWFKIFKCVLLTDILRTCYYPCIIISFNEQKFKKIMQLNNCNFMLKSKYVLIQLASSPFLVHASSYELKVRNS